MQPSPESNLRILPSSLKEILYSLAATHHFLILSPTILNQPLVYSAINILSVSVQRLASYIFSYKGNYVVNIKKRWQEYTENQKKKKHLNDPNNHDGVITHLELDILECEVKWTLGSITTNKASGGDRIPAELFQILKDDSARVLHSICQQIWKTQQWPQDWKMSVFIPIPKKGNNKECSNHHTNALILHASKVMLKILQPRLQQYMNHKLQDFQSGFRKGRGTRDQIGNTCQIIEKARELQNNICFSFMTKPKPLTMWITTKCGKFFKRQEYQTT